MQPGVIFDLDGVLIDSEELHYRAYCQVLEHHQVSVDRRDYAREWIAAGKGPEWAVSSFALPFSAAELKRRKQTVYHQLLQSDLRPMPGATNALERLSRDFPLALATNSSRQDVEFVLGRLSLRGFFRDVITRERYEHAKPAPDAFQVAAHALDREPRDCVVVEDSQRGVRAAIAAGIACIAIPNDFTRDSDLSAADRILGDLGEIDAELVRELTGD